VGSIRHIGLPVCVCVCVLLSVHLCTASPSVDIRAVVVVDWKIRGKIIRTVLCCVVYDTIVHMRSSYSLRLVLGFRIGLLGNHL